MRRAAAPECPYAAGESTTDGSQPSTHNWRSYHTAIGCPGVHHIPDGRPSDTSAHRTTDGHPADGRPSDTSAHRTTDGPPPDGRPSHTSAHRTPADGCAAEPDCRPCADQRDRLRSRAAA